MKRIDRKRLEALLRVQDVASVLVNDLSIAVESLDRKTVKFTPRDSMWDKVFWGKTALRTFLSQVEGISSVMRKTAVDMADELGIELSQQEKLELVEPRLSPIESLKLALRHYPALFGVKLDLDEDPWQALSALVDLWHEITHPETLEHMLGREIYRFLVPGYTGFLARLAEVLSLCASVIPGDARSFAHLQVPSYGYEERQAGIFSAADSAALGAASLRTLENTRQALKVLMEDTSRAISFSSSLSKIDTLLGRNGQFGLRNWVRTFVSEVEGTLFLVRLFIASAAERGELSLPAEDRESLEGDFEIDEQFVRVLNLWSREFGSQKQVKASGPRWQAFRSAPKIRHRLTHPKAARDLKVSLDEVGTMGGADKGFREATELVGLDGETGVKKPSA